MKKYQTKVKRLSGTRYTEIYDKAYSSYINIKKKSKRQVYIRSVYFSKQKIFLALFWHHLNQKNWRDRARRLRFLPAAIELIQHSTLTPEHMNNPNKKNETFYRFSGITKDKHSFIVQIKTNTRTKKKWFISTYPTD